MSDSDRAAFCLVARQGLPYDRPKRRPAAVVESALGDLRKNTLAEPVTYLSHDECVHEAHP